MIVRLYIGAHKTATTYIQKILKENEGALYKHNVKVSVPDDLRQSWLPDFFEYIKTKDEKLVCNILKDAPANGIWIIAEENIPGVSYDYLSSTEMYPNLRERLKHLKDIFKGCTIELFFSIRSYETYYRSAYLEVVRNKGYFHFSEFYNESRFVNNSWLKIIDVFCEYIPEKNINIWCYEDSEEIFPVVINRMTSVSGQGNIIKQYPEGKTRTSISEKTLMILKDTKNLLTQEESKALVESLNKMYPSGEINSIFMPFNNTKIASFQHQYKNEVSAISEKYPEINLIK